MANLNQQIADLEAEIDVLSDAAEQCRKSMIVAKVAIVGGLQASGAALFGLIWSDSVVLLVGITATLAGIGFYGSSRSTREQIAGKIKSCEARRAELIDGMDLRTVQVHESIERRGGSVSSRLPLGEVERSHGAATAKSDVLGDSGKPSHAQDGADCPAMPSNRPRSPDAST
jgi:hypothetical protein